MNVLASWGSSSESLAIERQWKEEEVSDAKLRRSFLTQRETDG